MVRVSAGRAPARPGTEERSGWRQGSKGESGPVHWHEDIINQIGKWFEKPPPEHSMLVIRCYSNFFIYVECVLCSLCAITTLKFNNYQCYPRHTHAHTSLFSLQWRDPDFSTWSQTLQLFWNPHHWTWFPLSCDQPMKTSDRSSSPHLYSNTVTFK